MEEETTSYPPIEPSNFDLIIVGTGLPESILAAAASTVGKSVLHLDPNAFYGTHFASLQLQDLITFLQTQSQPHDHHTHTSSQSDASDHFTLHALSTSPLFASLEINSLSSEPIENSRRFAIDLAGPRALFCADKLIDLILNTNMNEYMEFKGIDASFIGDSEGNLETVPDSRSAIFKDKKLSFTEKNQLMRFFKLVKEHFESLEKEEKSMIAEEDLEMPFSKFLSEKMGLSSKLKSIILYAIALADYDQENVEVCKDLLKTKDGINSLALYNLSVGRFPNAPGAMIYPMYGQGELPQGFCRRAAVKGCINVLRMPVVALLMDKESGNYKGVKLESGQELFSDQLILAPSFTVLPQSGQPSSGLLFDGSRDLSVKASEQKLARAICITNNSLKPDVANCVVFYPPRSLHPEQVTAIRVMQLSSNLSVCPPGMFVTYLSATCDDAGQGKNLLRAAMNALFSLPISGNSESTPTDDKNENAEAKVKPSLLWSALYIQELTSGQYGPISYTPTTDGDLHYNNLVDATKELFQKMFPNEEFFPKQTNSSDEVGDEGVPEQE